jgi:tetratricopeptide (TPR) repeat protein
MGDRKETGWFLLEKHDFKRAIVVLTEELSGPAGWAARANRALAYMNLGDYSGAINDYSILERDYPTSDAYVIMMGVAQWLQGDKKNAIDSWRSGLGRGYTDEAGGVEIPALLWFASLGTKDSKLEGEALRLMKKLWRPRIKQVWPGPIVGYLLDQVSEDDFLFRQTFQQEILEIRRQCRAQFWVGTKSTQIGSREKALDHFRTSANSPYGILEPEYYLAKGQLAELA